MNQKTECKENEETRQMELRKRLREGFVAEGMEAESVERVLNKSFGDLGSSIVIGDLVPIAKKPKKTHDRGSKALKPGPNMQTATATEKLQWMDEVFDPKMSEYIEKDRNHLKRMATIVRCFRTCCQRDVELFLAKHAPGKNNFANKNVKCTDCLK